jgi:hypothetical protein
MGNKVNALSLRSYIFSKKNLNDFNWFINDKNFKYSILLHNSLKIEKFLTHFFLLQGFFIHKIFINKYYNNINISIEYYYNHIKYNILIIKLKLKKFVKFRNTKQLLKTKKINKYFFKKQHLILKLLKEKKLLRKKYFIFLFILNNFFFNITNTTIKLNLKNIFKNSYKINKLIKYKFLNYFFKFKRQNNFFNILQLFFCIFNNKSSKLLVDFLVFNLQKLKIKERNRWLYFIKTLLIFFQSFYKKKIIGIKILIKGRLGKSMRSRKTVIKVGNIPLNRLNVKISHNFNHFITKNGVYGIKVWICHI